MANMKFSNEPGEKGPKETVPNPRHAMYCALVDAKTGIESKMPKDAVLRVFKETAGAIISSCKGNNNLSLEMKKSFLLGTLAIGDGDAGKIKELITASERSEWFVRKDIFSSDYLASLISGATDESAKKEGVVRWLSSLPPAEKIRAAEKLKTLKPTREMSKDVLRAAILSVAKEWVAANSERLAMEYGRESPTEWSATDDGLKYRKGVESGSYSKYGQVNCATVYLQMYAELLKNTGGVKSFNYVEKNFSDLKRGDIIQVLRAGRNAFPGAEHSGLGTHAFLVAGIENGEISNRVDFGQKGFVLSRTSDLVGQYSTYTPKGGKVNIYSVE